MYQMYMAIWLTSRLCSRFLQCFSCIWSSRSRIDISTSTNTSTQYRSYTRSSLNLFDLLMTDWLPISDLFVKPLRLHSDINVRILRLPLQRQLHICGCICRGQRSRACSWVYLLGLVQGGSEQARWQALQKV